MNFFKRFFYGRVSFPVSFWVFGVLAYFIFSTAKTALFLSLLLDGASLDEGNFLEFSRQAEDVLQGALEAPALLALVIGEFLYAIYACIGIWRSSTIYKEEHGGETIWAVLAKIVVVLSWASFAQNIFVTFLLI